MQDIAVDFRNTIQTHDLFQIINYISISMRTTFMNATKQVILCDSMPNENESETPTRDKTE